MVNNWEDAIKSFSEKQKEKELESQKRAEEWDNAIKSFNTKAQQQVVTQSVEKQTQEPYPYSTSVVKNLPKEIGKSSWDLVKQYGRAYGKGLTIVPRLIGTFASEVGRERTPEEMERMISSGSSNLGWITNESLLQAIKTVGKGEWGKFPSEIIRQEYHQEEATPENYNKVFASNIAAGLLGFASDILLNPFSYKGLREIAFKKVERGAETAGEIIQKTPEAIRTAISDAKELGKEFFSATNSGSGFTYATEYNNFTLWDYWKADKIGKEIIKSFWGVKNVFPSKHFRLRVHLPPNIYGQLGIPSAIEVTIPKTGAINFPELSNLTQKLLQKPELIKVTMPIIQETLSKIPQGDAIMKMLFGITPQIKNKEAENIISSAVSSRKKLTTTPEAFRVATSPPTITPQETTQQPITPIQPPPITMGGGEQPIIEQKEYQISHRPSKKSPLYNIAEGGVIPDDIYTHKVKVKDIFFAGDDINEFGYFGQPLTPSSSLTTGGKYDDKIASVSESTGIPKNTIVKNPAFVAEIGRTLRGIREAYVAGKKFSKEQVKDVQEEIISAIEESGMPSSVKGRFLRTIKNIQTPKQLEKALPDLTERIDYIAKHNIKQELADDIKSLMKATNIPARTKEHIRGLISEYDLAFRGISTVNERISREEWLNRQDDEDVLNLLPKGFWKGLPRKTLNEMSVDELTDLRDTIKRYVHQGKVYNKLLSGQQARDLETATIMGANAIHRATRVPFTETNIDDIKISKPISKMSKISRAISDYFGAHRKVENLSNILKIQKNTFDVIQAGKNNRTAQEQEAANKYGSLLDRVGNLQDEFTIDGVRTPLTRGQMIGVYGYSLNPAGYKRLIENNKFTPDEIKRIKEALPQAEKDFVKGVIDMFNSNFGTFRDVVGKLFGYYPKAEKNYLPLIYDTNFNEELLKRQEAQDAFQQIFESMNADIGARHARVGSKTPLKLDITYDLFHKLMQAIHFNNMAIPVRDVKMFISHPRIKNAITNTMGEAIYKQFPSWLSDIANPHKYNRYEGGAAIVNFLNNSATVANLGARLTVALQQPVSITMATNKIGSDYTLKGLTWYITHGKSANEFMKSKSIQQATRDKYFDREIANILNSKSMKKFLSQSPEWKDLLFVFIRAFDKLGSTPTWLGAYLKGMDDFNNNEAKAIKYADHIVRTTQPTGAIEDLAKVMRGGAFQKMWTMFMSHFANVHNQTVDAIMKMRIEGRRPIDISSGGVGGVAGVGDGSEGMGDGEAETISDEYRPFLSKIKFARAMFWVILLPAVISQVIKTFGRRVTPKDMLKAVASYSVGGAMIMRDIANATLNRGFGISPPTVGGFENIAKGIHAKKIGKRIFYGTKGLGQISGTIPTQFIDTLMAIYELMEGETDDPRRLFWSEYALGDDENKQDNKNESEFKKLYNKRKESRRKK